MGTSGTQFHEQKHMSTYSYATLQQYRDYDHCIKDGIIDALAEDFHTADHRWWQTLAQCGVEQTLTGDDFSPSVVPNSKSKKPAIFIPLLHDNPNLAARQFELSNRLSTLPAALLQKERLVRKQEA